MSDEALREILDICLGWSRPMFSADKVAVIKKIAEEALGAPGKDINALANEAFDYMRRSKDPSLNRAEREAWEAKAAAVWSDSHT